MTLCDKKQANMDICMCGILFLKVFSDMFYKVQIMDIALTGLCILLLGYAVIQKRIKLNICDVCILALSLLFTISFAKDMRYYRDYVKIMSGFGLYFLGRYTTADVNKLSSTIAKAYLAVFVINAIYCLLGFGVMRKWIIIMYRGTYYYKTDFAAMIAYFIIFFYMKEKKYGWTDYILMLLAGYLIVMSNSRIFYLICSLLIGFHVLYRKDEKLVSVKGCIVLFIFAVLGVLAAIIIPKLPIFSAFNMIGFDIDSASDLFGNSNMQGRNNIWRTVLTAFSKTDLLTQLFGAELSFNDKYGLPGFSEHSLYVKLILNSGYIGLLLWLVFVAAIVWIVWKDKNRKLGYFCGMLLAVYLIEGITVHTIVFTSSTWMTMFFCGWACSQNKQLNE